MQPGTSRAHASSPRRCLVCLSTSPMPSVPNQGARVHAHVNFTHFSYFNANSLEHSINPTGSGQATMATDLPAVLSELSERRDERLAQRRGGDVHPWDSQKKVSSWLSVVAKALIRATLLQPVHATALNPITTHTHHHHHSHPHVHHPRSRVLRRDGTTLEEISCFVTRFTLPLLATSSCVFSRIIRARFGRGRSDWQQESVRRVSCQWMGRWSTSTCTQRGKASVTAASRAVPSPA